MKAGPEGTNFKNQDFLFNLNACTGCNACQLACSTENDLDWDTSWRQVLTFNPDHLPSIPSYHLSLACNHCAQAPCLRQCPALAITRDGKTGAVLIDPGRCIGCGYCSWVCPYDAPVFDEDRRVMTKCTGCRHRLVEDQPPACVQQCPTGALGFGVLNGAAVVPGFPDTPAQPAIRFQPYRRPALETSWQPPQQVWASLSSRPADPGSEISLVSEWPLLIFTLIASGLAGWMFASVTGKVQVNPLLFLTLAGAATVTSTLHLGQKRRAWRAILNLRHSWLSREIVSFGAFAAASLLALLLAPELKLARAGCTLLGLAAVFSMDRVYDPVRQSRLPLHSADTLLTALLLAALLSRNMIGFGLIGSLKLLLYAARKWSSPDGFHLGSWMPGLTRVGAGLLLPAGILLLAPTTGPWLPVLALAIGELIDRTEFYSNLAPTSPRAEVVLASGTWYGQPARNLS